MYNNVVCSVNIYPLDSDLSGGECYPPIEQLKTRRPHLFITLLLACNIYSHIYFKFARDKIYCHGSGEIQLLSRNRIY